MEEEAARLSSLASRLLRAAQLDREEVKPDLELTDMADLVATLADQYSRQWSDRKVSVRKEAAATRVMADAELRIAVASFAPVSGHAFLSGSTGEQRRVIRRLVRGWVYTLRGRSFMHTAGAWNSTLE